MSRFLTSLVALALMLAACSTDPSPSTSSGDVPTTAGVSTTAPSPTGAPTTSTSTTVPDLSGLEGLSPEVQEQLAGLVVAAQELRGLSFSTPPKIVVVSPEELEQRVRENLEEVAEDFPADEALYKLLGLLDSDVDLAALLTELYSEGVGGFYDFEAEEIVVPTKEEGFSLLQQGTLIHELVHALTDQNFDVQTPYEVMLDEEHYDQASGYLALIEGDAQLVEFQWIQTLSRSDLAELLADIFTIDTTLMESAPAFIQDSLIFPYDSGMVFVQDLFESGGWDAVNDAYLTFPSLPASTEQVITPDDFGLDLPIVVELPEIVLDGYDLATESVWGESGFKIMISQGLGADVAVPAADGWGGDYYYQWFDGENAAFVIGYVGDTVADLEELEEALVEYAFNVVPDEDFVWVEAVDGVLYFIAADDPQIGVLIRSAVGAG